MILIVIFGELTNSDLLVRPLTSMPPVISRRRESLVSEISRTLLKQIRSGKHPAGTLLPSERHMSESFRVSRTVLREAVRELESQGLVEVRHGVGIRVVDNLHRPVERSMSLLIPDQTQRLLHLMEARLLIEPPLARLAAQRSTESDWNAMALAQKHLKDAADSAEAMQADLEFHQAVTSSSGNGVIHLMLEAVADLGRESRMVTLTHFGFETAYRQHDQILDAIMSRIGDHAEELMRQHLERASQELNIQISGKNQKPSKK